MKVSIIVPVWNVEDYLPKCLDSLVNQTITDFEIIIVNDGSPDNSQKIIDKYVKKYPKLIKSFIKENGGLSSARNYGLTKATGKFISFVDSDDWLDINALNEMYLLAIQNKSDVVICDMVDHYGTYEVYHDCTHFKTKFEKTPSACNKMFKKSIIKNKFIEGMWYEDLNFTTKILMNTNNISTISKGFYHCHCHEGSIMNNNNSMKNLDILVSINDMVKYGKENKLYKKYKAEIDYLIINNVLITAINRVNNQKNKDKKAVIKKLLLYCKKNVGNFRKNSYFLQMSRNKKIIAILNYNGLFNISKLLLNFKSKIKGR